MLLQPELPNPQHQSHSRTQSSTKQRPKLSSHATAQSVRVERGRPALVAGQPHRPPVTFVLGGLTNGDPSGAL